MSKLYPVNIDPKEAQVKKLVQIFQSSYTRIVREINGATDFGVANRRVILAQIESILTELGDDIQKFIDKNLPGYYKRGASEAVKQLRNIKADIEVKYGFNRLHRDALVALIDDTVAAYAESITGVKRSATLLLGRATRDMLTQEIAYGILTGDALRKVRQNIKGILAEQGLSALVDKAGRRWSLDRYAEMLYRTKVVEARNMGLINRMVENNYDLVQVSTHMGSCPLCTPWEGKILSATGATRGYETVADATGTGLFHPNCRHAINVLTPSIAKKTQAYDPEKGKLIRKAGESLTRRS